MGKTKILVTGTAGFIGFHLIQKLVTMDYDIVGLDNINDYYDTKLKYDRLAETGITSFDWGKCSNSTKYPNYKFIRLNLEDKAGLEKLFAEEKFDKVCNLAAQAGVRYSLTNPDAYISANITGFLNILELCRHHGVKALSYASSSSVYGLNEKQPFSTSHNVDHPVSLYAASKKSNELMAHTYSHLFKLPTTGLRFFTVYGPWGRPDMALFIFTKAIIEGKPIDVFNYGEMKRDFTYVDDIINGVVRVIENPPVEDPEWNSATSDVSSSKAAYKVYNIGNSSPVRLMDFIEAIETKIGKVAEKNMLPLQAGDVPSTYADVSDLTHDLGYKPTTDVVTGVGNFIDWYRGYYKV